MDAFQCQENRFQHSTLHCSVLFCKQLHSCKVGVENCQFLVALSRPHYMGYYSSYKAMKLSDVYISLGLYAYFRNQFNNSSCLCIWLRIQTPAWKEEETQDSHEQLLLQVAVILFTMAVLAQFAQVIRLWELVARGLVRHSYIDVISPTIF